jgi:hypothetical protein
LLSHLLSLKKNTRLQLLCLHKKLKPLKPKTATPPQNNPQDQLFTLNQKLLIFERELDLSCSTDLKGSNNKTNPKIASQNETALTLI